MRAVGPGLWPEAIAVTRLVLELALEAFRLIREARRAADMDAAHESLRAMERSRNHLRAARARVLAKAQSDGKK